MMSRAGALGIRSSGFAVSPDAMNASGTRRTWFCVMSADCENVSRPKLMLLLTPPTFVAVLASATANVSGWTRSTVLRVMRLEPDHVALFQKCASLVGAENNVIGERERLADGSVHS